MTTKTTNGKAIPMPVSQPDYYRCPHCGRLLFRAILVEGCKINIRCPKCSRLTVFQVVDNPRITFVDLIGLTEVANNDTITEIPETSPSP